VEREFSLHPEVVMTKATFLDRDGVINQKAPAGQYVTRWEDFHFLPGAIDAIAQFNHAGFLVIVVTNQRCVAKGLLSENELNILHKRMTDHLSHAGARIDAIHYCPHELEPPCSCRKPAPGMLLAAARAQNLDLAASWMIGDSDIDIQAGKNAGCRTARVTKNRAATQSSDIDGAALVEADITAASLYEAVPQILKYGNS
jgi:D-glycero-D-manno-heptose 1,7-bisphosphate phosphatase